MKIVTIAGRELRSLFLSPLAWTILGVTQLILAYLFLSQIDYYLTIQPKIVDIEGAPGVTDLVIAPLFANAAVTLLLITPLLTMRLISEERRNQTLSLLFSAPLSITEIILGKFLGIMAFMLIMIGLIVLMPLSLMAGATLDYGKLAAGVIALVLLMGAFSAVGLYMSSIASQPTVAAIGSFGLLLLLWILDWAGSNSDKGSELFANLSLLHHFENLLKGLIHSADIAYYLLFIVLFLTLSIRRLDNDRLQK
jgi:ABC-2 type transport system permease protein